MCLSRSGGGAVVRATRSSSSARRPTTTTSFVARATTATTPPRGDERSVDDAAVAGAATGAATGRSGARRRGRGPAPETAEGVGEDDADQKENELEPGSRAIVLCEEGREWRATVRRPHVSRNTGERGYKIHYDGTKRSVEYWVPSGRVVALLDGAGRRRRRLLAPPAKKRRRPTPVAERKSAAPDPSPPRKKRPRFRRENVREDVREKEDIGPLEFVLRVGYFCDDFDLFDGGLLRAAARDEALGDLRC